MDVDFPEGVVDVIGQEPGEVIITASIADGQQATRTSYDEVEAKNYWTPGDKIKVFSAGEAAEFTSLNTEPEPIVKFRGYIATITGSSNDNDDTKDYVWGLYPYSEGATYEEPDGISRTARITTTYPDVQVGVAGTFGDNLSVMIGRSESLSVPFRGAYSGAFFMVNRDDIVSITLRGLNNEVLAGTATLGLNTNMIPVVHSVTDPKTSVTVTAPNGTFEPGENYYLITLPDVALPDGYSVTLVRSDGLGGTYEVRANRPLNRIKFRNLSQPVDVRIEDPDNIADGLSTGWIAVSPEGDLDPDAIIAFADPTVKALCVSKWDTDSDGELSYAEAAAVTTIPYEVFSSNTNITSFDEFRFFTGVTSLGYDTDYDEGTDYFGAFSGCTNLKSITLPPTLTTIPWGCFRGCSSLEELYIPKSVTKIQQVAFLGCTSLEIHMESETPCTLQGDGTYLNGDPCAFGFLYSIDVKAIYVPDEEAATAYKAAQFWPASRIHPEGWVDPSEIITFQDALTELYCVEYWDTNEDGKLSKGEAAAVTDLGTSLQGKDIVYFEELMYFTGLESISADAFKNCNLLQSLSFPSSLTAIGANAFSGCYKLKKIVVPSMSLWIDVISPNKPFAIPGELYLGENLVTSLTLPEGSTAVGNYLCYNLSKLEGVNIPNSVTTIGDYAFSGCGRLASVSIPEGVTSIGKEAFYKCTSIASVSIPDGVTSIGTYAFYGCSSLSSATLPQGFTTLPAGIFSGCVALSSVYPDSYRSVGDYAFQGCAIESMTVTGWIGKYAFENCENLSSITLVDGFNRIQRAAFRGCAKLKEISLPESVGTSSYALYDALLESYLGLSYELYGAFYGSSIESIECYDNLLKPVPIRDKGYGDSRYSYNLSELNAAFKFIYKKSINEWVSANTLSTLKRVTVKKSTSTYSIQSYAFCGFTALETVNLPTGLTSVDFCAFDNCKSLESFDFQATLRGIGNRAFGGCAFKHVVLKEGLNIIDFAAFANCRYLESIILPESLDEIGQYAFENCTSLTDVVIPGGVTKIGYDAFKNCSSLTELTVKPSSPPVLGLRAFPGNYPIYVPAGCVDTYKSAEGWSEYADRIQVEPSQVVQLEGVSIPSTLTMANGSTAMLTPTFTPSDATNTDVTWLSSNTSVATVNAQGNVTAVGNGTTTITVTTNDGGFTATCTVTVNNSGRPFPEGNTFDEDAYITYVANHQGWFIIGQDATYRYDTYFRGVSGTRIEMKFQVPDYSSWGTDKPILTSCDDGSGNGFGCDASNVYYWSRTRQGSYSYTNLVDGGIDGTGVIVLSAELNGSQITTSVNGTQKTISSSLTSFDLSYLFSSYYQESGDGSLNEYSAGVPDGTKLFYVKIWNGDQLVYNGYAGRATNPSNSTEEYCWYAMVNGTPSYTFAYDNTNYPSNYTTLDVYNPIRQTFGGGMD